MGCSIAAARWRLRWAFLGLSVQVLGQDLFLAVPPTSLDCSTPDCAGVPALDGKPKACHFPRNESACPEKIGGDCPRNYDNNMSDYDPASPLPLLVDRDLRAFLQDKVDEYLELVDNCAPPSMWPLDSADVFNGAGGRALMHLRLHSLGFKPAAAKLYTSHLARASEYIDIAVAKSSTISRSYCGFLWGRTGVLALAAIVQDLQGHSDRAAQFVEQVRNSFENATDDHSCPYDDWDAGRAGLLYAAALLDHHFGEVVIPRRLVLAVANATVERGSRLGAETGVDHMRFISPNDGGSWLGTSHGSAGVLYGLLSFAPELLADARVRGRIVRTLDHLVSMQQPSGNFPTEYRAPSEDILVQWDHGAPGVSAALLVAAEALPEGAARWRAAALRALDVVWHRGLLTKGLMLCHGLGGNIYMQLLAAKRTGNATFLHRALQFVRFVAVQPGLHDVQRMRIVSPSPFLFFVGSWESAVMWASDLVAHAEQPTLAAMPLFEVTL